MNRLQHLQIFIRHLNRDQYAGPDIVHIIQNASLLS